MSEWISLRDGLPEKGYYFVKHYNYNRIQILYFNGKNFEKFKSDNIIHDEIESYCRVELPEPPKE